MLDGTIDIDGSVRPYPGSTARFTVTVDRWGCIEVLNRDDRPIALNGDAVTRHGQELVHIPAGGRRRFVPLEAAVG